MTTLPLDRMEAGWRDAAAERQYWDGHQEELMVRYPDEYVAVADGKLVAHAPTLAVLSARVLNAGYSMEAVWIRFLAANDLIIL